MRRAMWFVGFVLVASGSVASPATGKRVAGQAVTEASICKGGVAVTQEDYDRLPPPAPLGGREFLVVAGAEISTARPAARFVTRPDGTFVTRLPPGTWCIFWAARRLAATNEKEPRAPRAAPRPNTDEGCLEAERRRCDLVLPVKSDVRDARIVFTERCSQPWAQPCYRGPMPP